MSATQVLPFAAGSADELRELLQEHRRLLGGWRRGISLSDVCLTAGLGVGDGIYRCAAVADSRAQLRREVDALLAEPPPGPATGGASVAFALRTPAAEELPGSAAALACVEEPYLASLERCEEAASRQGVEGLLEVLVDGAETNGDSALEAVATFALQLALVELWIGWGVRPSAIVGEGSGFAAALVASGATGLDEGIEGLLGEETLVDVATGPDGIAAWHADPGTAMETSGCDLAFDVVAGDRADLLGAVGDLFARGLDFEWQSLHGAGARDLRNGGGDDGALEALKAALAPDADGEGPPAAAARAGGGPADRDLELVTDWLRERVAVALRTDAGDLAAVTALSAQGLDSLRAIELKETVEAGLPVELPLRSLETATIAELAERIAGELQAEGDVEQLLAASTEGQTGGDLVPDQAARHEPFPLNEIQQAYWIGRSGLFDLGTVAAHFYGEMDVEDLDLQRAQAALQTLIARHDMLRAIVLESGEQQILEQVPPYEIEVTDLRSLADAAREERLGELREELSHQVLSAARPLYDIRATRLDKRTTRLHLSIDLIIADAASLLLFGYELHHLYTNPRTELPAIELSFRDYLLAEAGLSKSRAYRRSWDYWSARLDELPAAPQLPLARRPEEIETVRFQRLEHVLDRERWERLRERAAAERLTPSALLCAVYAEVLATWSAEQRFSLNVTTYRRLPLHPDVHRIIGDFTSLTLLAVDGAAPGSFAERARALQSQLWEDLEHRHINGVTLLRELVARGRPAASMPVVFTSALAPELSEVEGLESIGEYVYGISQTPQVWLDHQVLDRRDGIALTWDRPEGLFPAGMVEDMFAAYCALVERLADDPLAWLEDAVELVPAAQLERRSQLNSTARPLPEDARLHDAFFERAAEQPGAPALVAGQQRLTYGELAARVVPLARRLRELGARPDRLVAVVAEKGWEQVVAVLAVLEAGAAYLPIDPGLPTERLTYLLQQGEVELALTQPHLLESIDWPDGVEPVAVSDEESDLDAERPERRGEPDNLAYVIFTSGSTGVPKGVMIEHRAALNTVLEVNRRFCVGPADRVLAVSSLSFDLSVWDIFGILSAGGTVVMTGGERDPAAWIELAEREGVTVWNSVPALMKLACERQSSRGEALPRSLRLAMLSGDWIPTSLPDQIRELNLAVEVVSLGGATEAGIWSIAYSVKAVDPAWESIPYGRPLANQSFEILDAGLQPRPQWVPGEIFIGGKGLARGYWRDPAKTQAAFFFHPTSGERLYRTGDFGRYLSSGDIEFLGRRDDQVKVNGYRIELGEVEAALEAHPAVRTAVATTFGRSREERRLAAFWVPSGRAEASEEALREHLEAKLPEHMVPTAILPIESLPLTANGKVDRKALPDPGGLELGAPSLDERDHEMQEIAARVTELLDGSPPSQPLISLAGAAAEAAGLLPRLGKGDRQIAAADLLTVLLQRRLLAFVGELLDRDPREIEPLRPLNTLGLDSLMAIGMKEAVAAGCGSDLPLRKLVRGMSAADVAAEIVAAVVAEAPAELDESQLQRLAEAEVSSSSLPVLAPDRESLHEPFPLNEIQQAYWIGRSGLFSLGSVAAYYYLEVDVAELDLDRLREVVDSLVREHDMLRAIVLESGEQQILEQVPPYEIAVTDLRGLADAAREERLGELREELSHQVLPAARWPLFEIRATRLDEEKTRVHLGVDMIIADAASLLLFGYELARRYRRDQTETSPPEVSFRDYSLAQAGSESDDQRRAWDYWSARLDELPAAPQLPLARRPEEIETVRFQRVERVLDRERWERLRERAAAEGLTPSALLCAVYAEVLATWSAEQRFSLNVTTYRRLPLHPDVHRIIGDFTSLTLLEVDRSAPGTFAERARALQAQLWEDLEHRQVNGVTLLRELMARGRPAASMPVVFTSALVGAVIGEDGLDQFGEYVYGISQTPQVWLDNHITARGDSLALSWDWVVGLFPDGMVEEMFAAYCSLVERLADDPLAWLEDAPELVPAAQLERRAEANAVTRPLPEGARLHDAFFERAVEQPECLAVVAGEKRLTYAELSTRAVALARQLRERGARPDRLVAVVAEKGWEQAVAVLAVLEAGAAYLPIDPALPAERLAYLLEQGEVELALTQPHLLESIDWPDGVEPVAIAEADERAAVGERLEPRGEPSDLAYVIFTSGSTGVPKGVMIEHRAALNTVLEVNRRFGIDRSDRVFAVSALSFDLSVWDLFGVLGAGGTVVMSGGERDPAAWIELAEREGVTVWNSVPALMKLACEHQRSRGARLPGSLRLAMLSGDWIPTSLPDQIRELRPAVEVVSLGGPTEAAIWQAAFPIGEVDPAWESIPYGRPLANHRLYVLGPDLEPQPDWVPGEIFIGGESLARGYWRDPAKTQAAFFFHPTSGERLYRSGDIACWMPDGNLRFLGRRDDQVKVNGYRIELGEVEAALEAHPAVRTAVATTFGRSREERRLVAHYVPDGEAVDQAELRAFLAVRLPGYMVPSAIVAIERMPLSRNGKVDRSSLPDPRATERAPVDIKVETAEKIVGTISRILELDDIELEMPLLDLGVTSNEVIQIALALEQEFGFRPDVEEMFGVLTVRDLCLFYQERGQRP
jgi:yersiniabactin nonribosomal peptide synthetase